MTRQRRRVRRFETLLVRGWSVAPAATTRRPGIEHFDRSVGRARRHSLFLCIIVIIIQFDDDDDWF